MHMMRVLVLLLLLPIAANAQPAPVQLGYAAYIAGFRIFGVEVLADVRPDHYKVDIGSRTAGILDAFFHGDMHSSVTGQFAGLAPRPQRFIAWGTWSRKPRQTLIDYPDGEPLVRTLLPPQDEEREPVPEEMTRGTVDTLSAMAMLVHHVAQNGRCDGGVKIYDGRRMSEITVTTGPTEVLEPEHGSPFAGPALRCDFVGRQLAGFLLDADRERARRPQEGAAWLAPPLPGMPAMPVRMRFEVRLFGQATAYLTEVVAPR